MKLENLHFEMTDTRLAYVAGGPAWHSTQARLSRKILSRKAGVQSQSLAELGPVSYMYGTTPIAINDNTHHS